MVSYLSGLSQVDLLQHKYLSGTVLRFEDFSSGRGGLLACLIQLLNQDTGLGFSVTVNCHQFTLLSLLQLLDTGLQQQGLSTAFLTDDDYVVAVLQPLRNHLRVFLQLFCQVNPLHSRTLLVLELAYFTVIDSKRKRIPTSGGLLFRR
jgi:hypothetical protein